MCAQGSDADSIIPDEVILRGTLRVLNHCVCIGWGWNALRAVRAGCLTTLYVSLLFVCAQGSDADNIIPDEVILRGTLRALTHEHMMFIKHRIEQVSLKHPLHSRNSVNPSAVTDLGAVHMCAALCQASWWDLLVLLLGGMHAVQSGVPLAGCRAQPQLGSSTFQLIRSALPQLLAGWEGGRRGTESVR